jgi:hypothetical protein
MDTKIKSSFWSDPDIEEMDGDEKLAILWLLTSGNVDILGFTPIPSKRRFEFETGKPFEALRRAYQGLTKGIVEVDGGLWIRKFIEHQVGRGSSLKKNNMAVVIIRKFDGVSCQNLKALVLSEYPELLEVLSAKNKALPNPSGGVREEKRRVEKSTSSSENGNSELAPIVGLTELAAAKTAINRWYGRSADRPWSALEEHNLSEAFRPGDIETFEKYLAASVDDQRENMAWPGELGRLLQSWGSKADRARAYLAKTAPPRRINIDPPGWREWLKKKYAGRDLVAYDNFGQLPPDIQREYWQDHPEHQRESV